MPVKPGDTPVVYGGVPVTAGATGMFRCFPVLKIIATDENRVIPVII